MKQFLIFISGFILGILAPSLIGSFTEETVYKPNDGLTGLTIFPEKGECITKSEIRILQVVKPNMALGITGKLPDQIAILLINYDDKSYYDDQKIEIPANKCAKQIGVYQYTAKIGIDKTVPVVVIE